MKVTKNQLRRIIREEKRRIMNEIGPARPVPHPEMKSPGQDTPGEKGMKNQFAAKKLQTVYKNLMNIHAQTSGRMYDEIQNQLILLEDAMELMGITY